MFDYTVEYINNIKKYVFLHIGVRFGRLARNEDTNPFIKSHMGRKVDMKGVLVRTPNKFEALCGEVANRLSSIGLHQKRIF